MAPLLDFLAPLLAAVAGAPRALRGATGGSSWRDRLLAFVARRPGERLNVIWHELGANRGTARYHLLMLARDDEIRVIENGRGHARYFPAATKPADIPMLGVLLRGRVLEVARQVLTHPGVAQHDLTTGLPMSRKVFREYANLLVKTELIAEVREPHARRYYPKPRLAGLVAQLPPAQKPGVGGGRP